MQIIIMALLGCSRQNDAVPFRHLSNASETFLRFSCWCDASSIGVTSIKINIQSSLLEACLYNTLNIVKRELNESSEGS